MTGAPRDCLSCHARRAARTRPVRQLSPSSGVALVIEVLADQAPDLHEALEQAKADGLAYVILDGKIFSADRCDEKP
jgi:hypothetical protein